VDALYDGQNLVLAGIMEHIEEAGVHSGDSACILPPQNLTPEIIAEIKTSTLALARELAVLGLINIQYAVKENKLYIIEVNPRASRTVPFVSKAIGFPIAKIATKIMMGHKLPEFKIPDNVWVTKHISVKEVVLPFKKFPGVDTLLGPEMKSTGEVMGISDNFERAFYKATTAAGDILPQKGNIFFSINEKSKRELVSYAKKLQDLNFNIYCTKGTAEYFENHGVKCTVVKKIHQGRPNVVDLIKSGEIHLVINTPTGKVPRKDATYIREAAVKYDVPSITTIPGAKAAIKGIESILSKNNKEIEVCSLQDYHKIQNKK
jgi:carbamoyl-phosphate synthase large subunit